MQTFIGKKCDKMCNCVRARARAIRDTLLINSTCIQHTHMRTHSINFNHDSTWLCVASDHGTVHVFAVEDQKLNRQSSLASATFLPKYFSSSWSFCKFQVPGGPQCMCAFGQDNNSIIGKHITYTYVRYYINVNLIFTILCAQ